MKLGIIHYEAGRFNEAKRPLAKIPANHALKADADYFSAWTELDNGKPSDAARKFKVLRERLARSDAESGLIAESYLYQGIAEFEARQFGTSAQTLAGFLEAHGSHEKVDEGAFNLGLAHMELTRWDQAIGALIRSTPPRPFGIGRCINRLGANDRQGNMLIPFRFIRSFWRSIRAVSW